MPIYNKVTCTERIRWYNEPNEILMSKYDQNLNLKHYNTQDKW